MTKIDRLVNEMIFFEPSEDKRLTLRAPLDSRSGEAIEVSFDCTPDTHEQLRVWLRTVLMVSGEAIADHFNLTEHTPSAGGVVHTSALHPEDVFESVLYALGRG